MSFSGCKRFLPSFFLKILLFFRIACVIFMDWNAAPEDRRVHRLQITLMLYVCALCEWREIKVKAKGNWNSRRSCKWCVYGSLNRADQVAQLRNISKWHPTRKWSFILCVKYSAVITYMAKYCWENEEENMLMMIEDLTKLKGFFFEIKQLFEFILILNNAVYHQL